MKGTTTVIAMPFVSPWVSLTLLAMSTGATVKKVSWTPILERREQLVEILMNALTILLFVLKIKLV
jgi:hypothetical protein